VIPSPASVVESKPKVREASFGEAIRSPASVVESKPNKIFSF
jgi:hypothetical protein